MRSKNPTSKRYYTKRGKSTKRGKQRAWSKLQKEVYDLIDPDIDFQLQCRTCRLHWNSGDMPTHYWVSLGKETLWEYPKQFVKRYTRVFETERNSPITINESYVVGSKGGHCQPYPYITDISEISDVIREYIDTPRDELFDKEFENDFWEITDLLRAADRRIGKERLKLLRERTVNDAACIIINTRLAKYNRS